MVQLLLVVQEKTLTVTYVKLNPSFQENFKTLFTPLKHIFYSNTIELINFFRISEIINHCKFKRKDNNKETLYNDKETFQ